MADYKSTALDAAHSQSLTSGLVAMLAYEEIASLAKVTIAPDGSSPSDFFYTVVRQYVLSVLHIEEEDTRKEAIRLAMEIGLKKVAGENASTITLRKGAFIVSSVPSDLPDMEVG